MDAAEDRSQQRLVALGAAITALREAAGETKSAAAQATGLNRWFFTGVEAGQRNISLARLFDIADHFGVTAAALLKDVT
ncbi:helix-turn-helix domain-containing protein [Mycobacterium simiae]|uniref:helix-turn-helix domain-containing protein n=1 Tax=Mycobacterium simiae TaxID=1784 RepID=UPI002626B5AB|nr:helix-turn-helix transcriptional regulator [Mycobacterium simiae]